MSLEDDVRQVVMDGLGECNSTERDVATLDMIETLEDLRDELTSRLKERDDNE